MASSKQSTEPDWSYHYADEQEVAREIVKLDPEIIRQEAALQEEIRRAAERHRKQEQKKAQSFFLDVWEQSVSSLPPPVERQRARRTRRHFPNHPPTEVIKGFSSLAQ